MYPRLILNSPNVVVSTLTNNEQQKIHIVTIGTATSKNEPKMYVVDDSTHEILREQIIERDTIAYANNVIGWHKAITDNAIYDNCTVQNSGVSLELLDEELRLKLHNSINS